MLPLGTTIPVRCALPLKANIVQAGGLQKVFISVMKFMDPCSRFLANRCHVSPGSGQRAVKVTPQAPTWVPRDKGPA